MALTNGEAVDVNTLLKYVLGIHKPGLPVPSMDQAEQAAARLADKAYKTLHAGIRGDDVRQAWLGQTVAGRNPQPPATDGDRLTHAEFVGQTCHRDDCTEIGDHLCTDGNIRCLTDCVCPTGGGT